MVSTIRKTLATLESRSSRIAAALGGLTAIVAGTTGIIGGATALLNAFSPEKPNTSQD